ncbi:MAG: sigma-70 family RNA polymerase sigma factor [Vicinamibacterales bacterium]
MVVRAQRGDLEAFGRLVRKSQVMAYAVAKGVLHDCGLAEDAAQEAFLRAYRRLRDLDEPRRFGTWLRRIVITVALNMRRARRHTFLRLDDVPEVPVLDEEETTWSVIQRERLARALLILTDDERRLCDRRYHGRWSTSRLAQEAGVEEAVIRKRLQRVRDKLRREIEVAEQRGIGPDEIRPELPGKVIELLSRPKLIDLPENPVGRVLECLRAVWEDFTPIELDEIVDLEEASKTIGNDALYIERSELHRVDDRRILRYDLTLPLLLTVRYTGYSLRLRAAGKAYRLGRVDALHLEAFHQAEIFWLDERSRLDAWTLTGRMLRSVDAVLPGRTIKIVPTEYPMCTQAWELSVEVDGVWCELLAYGVFTEKIVKHVGGDPSIHTAMGIGYGLERLAMLRYGIDDARKIDVARVA